VWTPRGDSTAAVVAPSMGAKGVAIQPERGGASKGLPDHPRGAGDGSGGGLHRGDAFLGCDRHPNSRFSSLPSRRASTPALAEMPSLQLGQLSTSMRKARLSKSAQESASMSNLASPEPRFTAQSHCATARPNGCARCVLSRFEPPWSAHLLACPAFSCRGQSLDSTGEDRP